MLKSIFLLLYSAYILNVYENIVLHVQLDGKKSDKEYVAEIVSMLKLEEKLNTLPSDLSGGQQQRVAIARALAIKPATILADEPTGNLDSKTTKDVLELIIATSRKFNQTALMITHNNDIAKLTDRIVSIEDGKIVSVNPKA
ncbi:ATP-binding cassette domain-containing protein [Clostridium estertheticum]|nr:ATP-binding cassette domain-containing protein [Clostridium estertheticum]MBU3164608.1 ATP-binding cassette domain-containing protein [Clostridium estertheticum]